MDRGRDDYIPFRLVKIVARSEPLRGFLRYSSS